MVYLFTVQDSGNTINSYYYLGRVAHLLMDMSVPAHVLDDAHWFLGDGYEKFTKDISVRSDGNYREVTHTSTNTDAPDINSLQPYGQYTPDNYDNNLTKLFYNLAEKANDFDSDEVNGKSATYGNGKFRFARNLLPTGKIVSKVEYWSPLAKIKDLIRYQDYDIIQNDCENRIYYYESFYNEIDNTSNSVRVFYTDGDSELFYNLDENLLNDVWDDPIHCIYQPELQARAIGYVAALYQLFWDRTHNDDEYEENDTKDAARYIEVPFDASTLQCFDDDWYKVWVSSVGGTVDVTIDFIHMNGDLQLGLYDASGTLLSLSNSATDQEFITYTVPQKATGTGAFYFYRVFGNGNAKNSYRMQVKYYTTDAPDLQVRDGIPKTKRVTEGDIFWLDVYVYNAGRTAAGASHAKLYLSTDDRVDLGTILFDDYYVGYAV